MTDYRSPATTHSSWTKEDPTALSGYSNVATLGHTADGVAVTQGTTTTTTTTPGSTTAQDHHHHHHNHPHSNTAVPITKGTTGANETVGTDGLVKTGNYVTGLENHPTNPTPVPVVGDSYQNRVTGVSGAQGPAPRENAGPLHTQAGANNGNGLAVVSGIGGPLGGSVVLGGQCECTRNGGTCQHGAGNCICRGCTTAATTVNPGINIGVSTTQYTAPVGTSGIGGGVADHGTGIAGIVNPTNTVGAPVSAANANCECVKNKGACNCNGNCACTNCAAHRKSMQATSAGAGRALGGSEYVGTSGPNYTSATTTTTTTRTNASGSPVTDNSNVPYKPSDYTTGKPVHNSNSGVI